MGGAPRVRAEGSSQRQDLAQEDMFNFLNSITQNFGPGGTGPGAKAAKRLMNTELALSRQFGLPMGLEQQRVQQGLIANDPILSRLSKGAQQGLDKIFGGLGTAGRLPDDLRQNFTQEIRRSFASRGIMDSPNAALGEAVRLAGGREAFRAQRIAQAAPFISAGLSLGSAPARSFNPFQSFLPGPEALFGGQLQSRGIAAGVAGQNAQLRAQSQAATGQLLGSVIGAGATLGAAALFPPAAAGVAGAAGSPWSPLGQSAIDSQNQYFFNMASNFGF